MADSYRIADTLTFLKALGANNNKPWFDANRDTYDSCRAGFVTFVENWIERASALDPGLLGQTAKSSIFRINRDVRFSANKNPYKTNFSAYLAQGGKKFPGAGYYLHLDPTGSFFAAGVWMPEAPVLQTLRQEIDYNLADFEAILQAPVFRKWFKGIEGETLSRPPKGYEADNPAIAYLKMKSFIVSTPLSEKTVLSATFPEELAKVTAAAVPFVHFLNQPLTENP